MGKGSVASYSSQGHKELYATQHTHSQLSLALKVIPRPNSGGCQWLVPHIPSQQEQPALCCLVIQHRACLVILLLKSFNSVAPGHPPIRAKFCSWF